MASVANVAEEVKSSVACERAYRKRRRAGLRVASKTE